jgi:predicted nucleotidyltransferase
MKSNRITNDILLYDDSEFILKKYSKDQIIKIIQGILIGKVEEAYIFGSFNTPSFNKDSDLDLLLVVDTDISFHKRYKLFLELYDYFSSIDLLVYTPSEFKKIKKDSKHGFWKSVLENNLKIV